ncbi:glutathione S-transferase family protein [Hydrogenophaga sp. 5NK40-0174]|uniref:glutathione S-transferase family protein n=1 Tax=Hydrogenophaga sp. 5NK40-0174 TaxID=3127649 RepID=UPI00310C5417
MGIRIYGIFASRAVRPLWAAQELGLAFEHVPTPYANKATRTSDFMSLNPNGHIPVLIDEREDASRPIVVWESMACALYLARHHGPPDGKSITPASAEEDAQALRWSFWSVTELEADALTVLMHRFVMPEERRKPELADAALARLQAPLGVLDQALGRNARGGEPVYLAGDRFTVADVCVASVVNWLRPSQGLEGFEHANAWLHTCLKRPAYKALKNLEARQ